MLEQAHESVLLQIASSLGIASRSTFSMVCKQMWSLAHSNPSYWRELDLGDFYTSGSGSSNTDFIKLVLCCLRKSQGETKTLRTPAAELCPEAAALEGLYRFKQGLRFNDPPHPTGCQAHDLAALLPKLQELVIDERTCCLGGMTDGFARAIASGCGHTLTRLEVRFARAPVARLAAERFTDEGMSALADKCINLKALVLVHCSGITDRSLYAIAASCKHLQELRIIGYSEQLSDSGLSLLLQSTAPTLTTCHLSSKLARATDRCALALLQAPQDQDWQDRSLGGDGATQPELPQPHNLFGNCIRPGLQLQSLKLPRNITDASLHALCTASYVGGKPCFPAPALRYLHVGKSSQVSRDAVLHLLACGAVPQLACIKLRWAVACTLPSRLALLGGGSCELSVAQCGKGAATALVHVRHSVQECGH